jgi:hypothetical protein
MSTYTHTHTHTYTQKRKIEKGSSDWNDAVTHQATANVGERKTNKIFDREMEEEEKLSLERKRKADKRTIKKDRIAFFLFTMAVNKSTDKVANYLNLITGKGWLHVRNLIGRFLLPDIKEGKKLFNSIKGYYGISKSEKPSPSVFEYALRSACFKTLRNKNECEKKGIDYKECIARRAVIALIEWRERGFTAVKLNSDDVNNCQFTSNLLDCDEQTQDNFWKDMLKKVDEIEASLI